MARDHLQEVLRRRRCVELALAAVVDARTEYARAVAELYDSTGLSYGSLAPLLGVTRARVQQLVEEGRKVPPATP